MFSNDLCAAFSPSQITGKQRGIGAPDAQVKGRLRGIGFRNTKRKRCHIERPFEFRSQRFQPLACSNENFEKSIGRYELCRNYSVHASLERGYAAEPELHKSENFWTGIIKQLNALHRFSRPHTIIGTVIGITSVSILPLETMADISPTFLVGLLKALVPSLFMNIYIVGLNQLFDVEIDKINKPDLPIASGEFSMGVGRALVLAFSSMSFALALAFKSPPLIYALLIGFFLGTVYSVDLPLLRWKRYPFLAATSILSVRAVVIQLAFYMHMQKYVLGRPTVLSRSVIFATAFMCFFSVVIALFKDMPDIDGDREFGIESFSIRLGQERVFWLCINMLLIAYATATVVGTFSTSTLSKLVTVLGHGTLAYILLQQAQSIDLKSKASITDFYMFIWKLFYAEYFLIPFVR